MNIMKWWVGASYAMHPYFWSCTGATMSLLWVLVSSISKRQNLDSRSSTEAELIGADDVVPLFISSRDFIELQGFEVDEAVIYQDNLSSILLENNGR